jgi:hypothetical protein
MREREPLMMMESTMDRVSVLFVSCFLLVMIYEFACRGAGLELAFEI